MGDNAVAKKTVCVIGSGPSGLTAAKNFLDAGFDVTVFEAGSGIGGNWRFSETVGHSSVFETTHIISSKTHSQFADFPLPATASDYPSHRELLAYFESYAQAFGLLAHIQFNTRVVKCNPSEGGWTVATQRGDGSASRHFDFLVVCNGHHSRPRWPSYPGQFTGEYIHAHSFKKAQPFTGKRVLVIGGGNSACDIAVETSRVSQYTDISWRRGYWLIPKFMFGKPPDVLNAQLGFLPNWLRGAMREWLLLLLQGSNASVGLPTPDHHVTETHPTVNSELYYFVRHGKVHPRGDIRAFEGDTVHFVDGTKRNYDTVICATGYWIEHSFFDKQLVDFSSGPVPLYLRMLPADLDHVYFIGLFQPLGCIWPGAELQSKLAAQHALGRWKAPPDLHQAIARELAHPDYQQLDSPRHTITVDDIKFRKRLGRELSKIA
jgi:Flavin-binding monooxygenase-like